MKKIQTRIVWVGLLSIVLLSVPFVTRLETTSAFASPQDSPSSLLLKLSEDSNPECERLSPRVAYNFEAREYMVVWENWWNQNFHDIYARRVSITGELKNQFIVATGVNGDGKERQDPDIAASLFHDEYLVVYSRDGHVDKYNFEIWGQRISANGSLLGPEFQIMAWPNRAFWNPHVAFSSSYGRYLVIADVLDTTTGLWNDVAGRLVAEDGTLAWPGHAISAQDQYLQPHRSQLAYHWPTHSFLVVWRQYYMADDWDIYGARVSSLYGTVIDPPGVFFIDRSSAKQDFPAVAGQDQPAIPSDADRYLVAWQQVSTVPSLNLDVWGRELDGYGNPIGDRFPIANSSVNEGRPAVAFQPDRRFVVWLSGIPGSHSIWKFTWNPFTIFIIDPATPVASNTTGGGPAIARGHYDSHLVVYGAPYGPPNHIYGVLYSNIFIYLPVIKR